MHDHPEQGLDIRLLRVLHLLLTSSSVSRTADLLGQSQPAISAQLRRLRDIIGDPLLVRSGTHMVPTERGVALLSVVRKVLDHLDTITDSGDGFQPKTSRRHLRIMAANCFGPFFLPRISALIRTQAPGTTIDYCSMHADTEMMPGLEGGEIDLVIGNWPAPPEQLRFAPLLTTDIVCMVRQGHRLMDLRALDMQTYLTLDHLSPSPWAIAALSPIDGRLKELHLQRRIAVSVPEYTIAPSMLACTDLVFTTGRLFAEHIASALPLVIIDAPPELGRMNFYMLWHERSHASPCNKWLRDLVRGVAGEIGRFSDPITAAPRVVPQPGIPASAA